MTRKAVLFPGQGAQFVGMSADLIQRCPEAQSMFDAASEMMGQDLWQITTEGPEELLNSTAVSQPAIFVVSVATLKAIEAAGGADRLQVHATAGLSLGEYSALVFAGAMEFLAALEVVVHRGRYMQEACDREASGMTSLVGMNFEQVEKLLADVQGLGEIGISNVNADKQIVVSGSLAALERVAELAPEAGARRVISLKVAGAYHSPLMASASEKLRPYLENAKIQSPQLEFYPNVLGEPVSDPEQIRAGLLKQIEATVLWAPTMKAMVASDITEFLEVGPGRVCSGLLKQVQRRLPVTSLLDAESVADFLKE